MLIQFSFENFRSFRDDTVLDLSATKITEHSDHVVQMGNEKLLPVAAIFGANASGKSNVVSAFRFMMTYVIESYGYGDEAEEKKMNRHRPKRAPFMFDKVSRCEDSTFEVYFITSEENNYRSYNYGFSLGKNGVTEEWLNVKAKTAREYRPVFYRSKDSLDLIGIPKHYYKTLPDILSDNALVASIGAKIQIEELKIIRDWFLSIDYTNFGDPFETAMLSKMLPNEFDKKEVQDNVVKYFSSFDSSIVGFDVQKIKAEYDDTEHVKTFALHKIEGTDELTSIPLEEESDGTLKMLALYPYMHEVLEKGGILCIDELNARLHPLLVRSFVLTFLNKDLNKKHAQLVFTTHDTWQLSNNMLRRDEIWFTEKNASGVSSLYALSDFVDTEGAKIRKDESYEKNYMLGKYGGIPSLSSFDIA